MPEQTYRPLATVTLGSSASSVTFSSIPATYRDLILVTNLVNSSFAEADAGIRFNSDTGTNYFRVAMTGDGSTAASFSSASQDANYYLIQSTTISTGIVQVLDYSATDKHKTSLVRGNLTAGRVSAFAGRWANTAAITSLTIFSPSGTFTSGNTLNLFGVIA
jgi:hypothetical protein